MSSKIIHIEQVRDRLNAVSPSMCAMKWLHQTLYLHTGDNHSCYHPRPHHIGLDEIAKDPSALHNTAHKKQQRKMMLEGERPSECYYCWNIEDLKGDHYSDRMIHSASPFAEPEIEKLAKLPWDAPINPKYLEVSFGNNCNFRCGYCGPQASTMWMEEVKKHGDYDITYPQYSLDFLKNGTYYTAKEENPYIEAFWKWWPSLRNDLHTLRITGGEPLMNPAAMKFLDILEDEPAPNLELTINSNLGVSHDRVLRVKERIRSLVLQKKVKKFSFYTSIDSWGFQAEYMRTGLDCALWEHNMKTVIETGITVNLMCTFNVLSVTNFDKLLYKIIEWRKQYGKNAISFDVPYLKTPFHWMINILTEDFNLYMEKNLKFIKDNQEWFTDIEYEKFKRLTDYMRENPVDDERIRRGRRDFYVFFTENDKRLGTSLLKLFPEHTDFYQVCKEVYLRSPELSNSVTDKRFT
jgi:organic radical activating enzyme